MNWGQNLWVNGETSGTTRSTSGVDEVGPFDVLGAYDQGRGRVIVLLGDGFGDAMLDWTDNEALMSDARLVRRRRRPHPGDRRLTVAGAALSERR